eukprot:TRINITY_DN10417_c0_g1_i1.p1 TRINITY_DN10417_c0_g1~~TRINITY_DN10417_c0_g1_i1.p1  ORF type:complete len:290 (-),score=25.27 TRINITY_DN10417_c0_g1_i1:34-843(-)
MCIRDSKKTMPHLPQANDQTQEVQANPEPIVSEAQFQDMDQQLIEEEQYDYIQPNQGIEPTQAYLHKISNECVSMHLDMAYGLKDIRKEIARGFEFMEKEFKNDLKSMEWAICNKLFILRVGMGEGFTQVVSAINKLSTTFREVTAGKVSIPLQGEQQQSTQTESQANNPDTTQTQNYFQSPLVHQDQMFNSSFCISQPYLQNTRHPQVIQNVGYQYTTPLVQNITPNFQNFAMLSQIPWNSSIIPFPPSLGLQPVSYTHLTLPTIYSV